MSPQLDEKLIRILYAEQDRLDLTHHTFQLCLDGVLFRAPITTKPQHVLDLGTGTGIWAIQFADEYPSAQVIGTDLSPIQPSWVPPNCRFLVDDMESEWVFSDKDPFDFIHGRTLGGSVRDWPKFFKQAYDHLKPGVFPFVLMYDLCSDCKQGWVEMQEFGSSVYSDDDPQLLKTPNIKYWTRLLTEVGLEAGKDFDPDLKRFITEAGFEDVLEDVYKAPLGRWSKEPKLKELGMYVQAMAIESVEPYTLAILTRAKGWTVDECRVLIAKVHQELKDKNNHGYDKYRFTYGRKPLA